MWFHLSSTRRQISQTRPILSYLNQVTANHYIVGQYRSSTSFKKSRAWQCLNTLQWRHNERESQITSLTIVYSTVLFSRHWSKKTSKLRVTGLCAENSPVTGEFPEQMASNAENVSIRWRHHETLPDNMPDCLIGEDDIWGPFENLCRLTLIPSWRSNHMPSKECQVILMCSSDVNHLCESKPAHKV